MILLRFRRAAVLCLLLAASVLAGCATAPGADPRDPWESYNRRVTRFNEVLDDNVLQPVAKGYQTVFPRVVRTGVSNFFGNLADVWSTANNLLQLKPRETVESLARVGINSTVGLLGLVDVASKSNIERHREDFGQTLGHWGMGTGPYLVLPLLGPSTLRDTAALPVDWRGDLVNSADERIRGAFTALRLVDRRAAFLGAGNVLDAAALDKYTFVREAHLQRRRGSQSPSRPTEPEERYDLPEVPAPQAPAVSPPAGSSPSSSSTNSP